METNLWHFSLTVFTSFFAIMNPIANIPIYLGLVENASIQDRKKIAFTACLVAFIVVTAFAFLGSYIFQLFGITIPAFKITGGIIIFYVGFEMLLSKKSQVHNHDEVNVDRSVAISPLAVPILAGPGTIVTAMNYVTKADNMHLVIVIATFAVMIILTWVAFLLSNSIVKVLGNGLITVLGKIMGLILAIIGTSMVISGIKIAFNL